MKNPMKCRAKAIPERNENLTPFFTSLRLQSTSRNAHGRTKRNPPKFRQKISAKIGIELRAITGPDVPIPMITNESRPISLPLGSLEWSRSRTTQPYYQIAFVHGGA